MDFKDKSKAVPRSRLGRLSRMARMAGGVATGMLGEGVKQLSQGKRPKVSDMLLTPANAKRVAKQLSAMRGAAMKIGQLLSMETNDILPPELAEILSQLRNRALTMPRAQLEDSLEESYGENWQEQFENFDFTPLAAASIGQVHRATTLEGDEIVLKIQYPGVADSIDSDVDNIATLLRVTRLLPEHMDISTLLGDAKAQLHDEADYLQEAEYLQEFYSALEDYPQFLVPKLYADLSTHNILAMEFVAGQSIESLQTNDLVKVDELMSQLFNLMFKELFELRLMQTDANFANYQYQDDSQKIVLLDFGASRRFNANFVVDYKRLIRGVIANDNEAIISAADRLGYQASSASETYQSFLVEVFQIALEPFSHLGQYDFKHARISDRIRELSEQASDFKEFWQTPPTDILYLHRKLGGMYMLATRLGARVNCRALVEPWIKRLR